jgi:serine protease AprX
VLPPASVPAVISVGGIDDLGNPRLGHVSLYRSSYGPTIDGLQKPEVVTIADWVPAPILPGTPTAKQADLLHLLDRTSDDELLKVLSDHAGVFRPLDQARTQPIYLLRQIISAGLRDGLVIDKHYKMVDGTSFAAPIVSSVVAQMLEANPELTPLQVKQILVKTARRLPGVEVDRQGWGAVQPAVAVQRALELRPKPRVDETEL